ncbi:MAG: hypothetical protein ACPG49_13885 [Chitinophagales bacterium]
MKNSKLQFSKSLFFLFMVSILFGIYVPTHAQNCFIQFERLSDTSVRLSASGNVTTSPHNRESLSINSPDFFDTNPSNFSAILSNNTFAINGENISVVFGSVGGWGISFNNPVTGNLVATGSVILTWSNGQIKAAPMAIDLGHRDATNLDIICTVGIVAPSNSLDIPNLSEWGLLILALSFMTLGTLYLLQPSRRFEQEG